MTDQLASAQALLLQSERAARLLVINPGTAHLLLHVCVSGAPLTRAHCADVGSSTLRIGWASAEAPLEVAHVVAYRRRGDPPVEWRPAEVAPPCPVDDELEAAYRRVRACCVLSACAAAGATIEAR